MLQPRVAAPAATATSSAATATSPTASAAQLRRRARPGDRRGRHDGSRAGRRRPARGAGAQMVALAQAEVGQTEQPPGSNDSPRIAEYRSATAGSGVGPWCAYFVSWAAKQAGTPLGEQGQGFGARRGAAGTGRSAPAARIRPAAGRSPGDLIVWGGRHIGIVESVDPTAASRPSRATPRTRSPAAPTAPTATGRRATCGWRRCARRQRPARRSDPIRRRAARWCAPEHGRGLVRAAPSGTTATKPQPMLKTSHISSSGTSPSRWTARRPAARGAASSIA